MALEVQRSTPTPIYLNVYDLTPANGYFYWLGLGIYHSGLEGESTRNNASTRSNPSSAVL
jgi:hypothetical protein